MTGLTFLAVAALAAAALAATEAVLCGPNAPGATHSDIRSGRGAPGVPRANAAAATDRRSIHRRCSRQVSERSHRQSLHSLLIGIALVAGIET